MMKRTWYLWAGLALIALIGAEGCAPTTYQTPAPAAGQPDTAATTTAPVAQPTSGGAVAQLATTAANGLAAALADANAHNDTISASCWRYLQPIAQALATGQQVSGFSAPSQPIDFFSGIQAARDAKTFVAGGIPNAFYVACGPLISQQGITAANVLNNVGLGSAIKAATGL